MDEIMKLDTCVIIQKTLDKFLVELNNAASSALLFFDHIAKEYGSNEDIVKCVCRVLLIDKVGDGKDIKQCDIEHVLDRVDEMNLVKKSKKGKEKEIDDSRFKF
jgi:hypothetical protein